MVIYNGNGHTAIHVFMTHLPLAVLEDISSKIFAKFWIECFGISRKLFKEFFFCTIYILHSDDKIFNHTLGHSLYVKKCRIKTIMYLVDSVNNSNSVLLWLYLWKINNRGTSWFFSFCILILVEWKCAFQAKRFYLSKVVWVLTW